VDLPPVSGQDVLAQPTRARLFELLGDLKRPAGTDELARRLGLHPNGVRVHLAQLEAAGLVVRNRRRIPRGRPQDEWAVAPDAEPGGAPPQAYHDLALWLAAATPASRGRLRDVEAAGRRIGREIAPAPATPVGDALETTMAALGFQPALETRPGAVACTLRNCPYRDAVKQNQELVCTLHRGITRGVLDVVAPGAKLREFVPRDPDTAGCLIDVAAEPGTR
jgi:predicted ArsR family transcriptional regulator